MPFVPIIMGNDSDHPYWEYNNDSAPNAPLGIRQFKTNTEVYVNCRRLDDSNITGELSKTFWDNHYTT
jgi:hypothetical protein